MKLLDELISRNIASQDEQWRYLRFSWTWSLLGWVVALQTQPGASTASHHLRVTLEIQISKSLHVTRYLTSMFVSQSNCYATLITKCWSREVYASGTEVKLIDLQLGFWSVFGNCFELNIFRLHLTRNLLSCQHIHLLSFHVMDQTYGLLYKDQSCFCQWGGGHLEDQRKKRTREVSKEKCCGEIKGLSKRPRKNWKFCSLIILSLNFQEKPWFFVAMPRYKPIKSLVIHRR